MTASRTARAKSVATAPSSDAPRRRAGTRALSVLPLHPRGGSRSSVSGAACTAAECEEYSLSDIAIVTGLHRRHRLRAQGLSELVRTGTSYIASVALIGQPCHLARAVQTHVVTFPTAPFGTRLKFGHFCPPLLLSLIV